MGTNVSAATYASVRNVRINHNEQEFGVAHTKEFADTAMVVVVVVVVGAVVVGVVVATSSRSLRCRLATVPALVSSEPPL